MRRWGLIALALLLLVAAGARDAFDAWIARTDLPLLLAETSVEVRDRNGALLRAYQVEEGRWRMDLSVEAVDPRYLEMLVVYEDKRFWRHGGVDLLALARAVGQVAWNGRVVSGGSTLTMQVARLLENSGTGAWPGKLRQMRLAWALERRMSKREILTLYLLHAPYGGNIEGLRAATLSWFGKEPHRLTPSEAAFLVALPQAPEARRPDRAPQAALAARDRVLSRLARAGVLTGEEQDAARETRLPDRMRPMPRYAPHLSDRVVRSRPGTMRHDLTVDLPVQRAMEVLLREAVRGKAGRLSAAIVVADHRSGEGLASVGSPVYAAGAHQGFVDMTRALRSPGSTLKPLVYGLAFDRGLVHPETLIHDGPVQIGRYAPRNFDGIFRGDIRIRDALTLSLNIPVVLLTQEMGAARLMVALRRAGVPARLSGGKPGLAVSLGGVGVSLEGLVQLYAGLAGGGEGRPLRWSADVKPAPVKRVMGEVAAWQVGHILAGLAPPPGAAAGVLAYKTGTSYGHRDAWAIGWDGRHVIGVWMGRADGTPVPGAFGGDLAAPVLFEAFNRLKPRFDPLPPPPAATLLVGAAHLPPPLQRFRPRGAGFARDAAAPQLVFPPDGAVLASGSDPLTLKLRGGTPPFAVLRDGAPLRTGIRQREVEVPRPGPGFATFSVVDAAGQADRVQIQHR
ncbi:penicillin-binding protein 1C [Thalassococcus sp. S3]|uniref:penicillin-binding protein 1C n=1 Tax=Thalassococcus sp. S3 TaxID=2017482 RepID=UPI0010241DBE|nr:penicillin-binding protein 1C [Thalassococcus sp. S3]QBF29824.1 penicillin-binding protein 1C [Thalassococcus sp. S3]